MRKSFPFAKLAARLGIRGTAYRTDYGGDAGTNSKFEGCVPTLGVNGKLHASVIGVGSVDLGDVEAENVTFGTEPEKDPDVTNVRDAINNITKDTGGLALMRAKNLSDVADPEAAFNEVKVKGTVASSGTITAGVLGVASQTEVTAGTDTATDTATGSTYLAISPSIAKNTYLSKLNASAQSMAGPIALPADPASALHAATKQYVDNSIAASQVFPTALTIWVDSVNGNDTTGERGKMAKPVLTLTKAKTLAQSGDLIVVRPGTYNENDLAKNGVSWYFQPGAKVSYTSGGDSSVAVFNVASNEVCSVLGDGEFYNMHGSSSSRYVLYVRDGSKCVFRAKWVQSARSAIFVDAGSTGYANIDILDSLRSDDLSNSGSCAARLISGDCTLVVGREIFSNGSQFQAGLQIGNGTSTAGPGVQVVRCPKIYGKYNAIHFNTSTRSHVITQTCTATDGPAVKVDGGNGNLIEGASDLSTSTEAYPAVVMTKGRLSLINTIVNAANGPAGIHLNGTPYDAAAPYLILKNSEIWTAAVSSDAITASNAGYFKVRIVGTVQSDCEEPADVIKVGGTWDFISSLDS